MDTIYNRITVTFQHIPRITGPEILYQEDVTQILVIQGLDLPEYFVVDFCNEGDTTVIPITGTAEGVEIPDALLATGKTVKAYIVVSAGEGDVETRYMVKLPVQRRPPRSDIEPTDPQQQQIDALVANLNDGVSRAESAADTATQAAQLLQNPSAEATTLEAGSEATASYEDGTFSFGIPKGPKGDPMTYEDMTEEQKAELVQGPILEAQTAGVRAVNAAGTANVNAVNQAGEAQVGNVNQAGTTQVGNVNEAGDEQVQAVIDKGAEVRDSIPQDYTDLTENVTRLNQAINLLDGQVNDTTTGLDTKAPAIINTASGAIASFSDGSDSIPVKELVVGVEPVQDLHGYDSPWPAGGGVNLIDSAKFSSPRTSYGLTTSFGGDWIVISGTYTNTVASVSFRVCQLSNEILPTNLMAFPDSASSSHISASALGKADSDKTLTITLTGMVQDETYNLRFRVVGYEGSTAPTSWTPYENICPISGWTGAEIEGTGKNLFDNDNPLVFNGYITSQSAFIAGSNFRTVVVRVKPNTTYTVSKVAANVFTVCYASVQPSAGAIGGGAIVSQTARSITITTGVDAKYLWVYVRNSNTEYTEAELYASIQIEEGLATSYEPYTGSQISVTFPSSAGTVYGGTLTINPDRTGQLVVDRAMATFDGTETWYADSGRYRTRLIDSKVISGRSAVLSNIGYFSATLIVPGTTFLNPVNGVGNIYYYPPSSIATLDEFKDWLSENNLQIVYPLATPITYTLTPTEIDGILTTLYGTNNIWADCGDVDVTYAADTKLYIEHLIQPTEDDMTADNAIASGTFFMIGNNLYLATSQIAAGATITPGTNATQLSLADALNQLNT